MRGLTDEERHIIQDPRTVTTAERVEALAARGLLVKGPREGIWQRWDRTPLAYAVLRLDTLAREVHP